MELDTPKMSHEEMIDTLKGLVFGTFDRTTVKEREALDMAIALLEQKPCDDCVSRQAVLDIDFKRIILTTAKPAETIEQKVKALPSVQLPQNIIRCKECIFYTNFQKGKPWNVSNKYCNRVVTIKTSPDDFCSFAKAKMFEP